jgi:3-oxoacyl-[acyl-carrier protein] reductase
MRRELRRVAADFVERTVKLVAMAGLEGKRAIVSGAFSGIGAATAKALVAAGATVVTGSRRDGTLDVTDEASSRRFVDDALARLGGLDILVNNAGVTRDNLLFKMSEDDWDAVMNVHLRGSFLMSREAQKHMVTAKYGKILNLSSVSALGNRGQANYSAAKMGLQGFTRTLAVELGPFGINVNAVAPGFIVTDMTDATARRVGVEPEDYRKAAAELTPVRRVGYPEDIAATAAFLCSDEASFITGQTLYVDGGAKL